MGNHKEWIGSFDWTYAIDDSNSIIDLNQAGDRYGFKIKRSGKVLFFKNGKLTDSGEMNPDSGFNDGFEIDLKNGDKLKLTKEFGEIRLQNFPMKNYANVYKKLDK
ncbi:MAG: hypothetical protein HYZ43_06150 [Flavobacteriia bacterium]|nr:hypothetical protein [Flavobacteriia bacterium]